MPIYHGYYVNVNKLGILHFLGLFIDVSANYSLKSSAWSYTYMYIRNHGYTKKLYYYNYKIAAVQTESLFLTVWQTNQQLPFPLKIILTFF